MPYNTIICKKLLYRILYTSIKSKKILIFPTYLRHIGYWSHLAYRYIYFKIKKAPRSNLDFSFGTILIKSFIKTKEKAVLFK